MRMKNCIIITIRKSTQAHQNNTSFCAPTPQCHTLPHEQLRFSRIKQEQGNDTTHNAWQRHSNTRDLVFLSATQQTQDVL